MTLIEITIAITILAVVVALIYSIIDGIIRGRDLARDALHTPKVANAVLAQIFKDFRYASFPGLTGDAGFLGKSNNLAGMDADRVDFITTRPGRLTGADDDGQQREQDKTSPLSEVGYACRVNEDDRLGRWLELWRREDYFIDDDPTAGGMYSLVYDKIRTFDLRYFPTPDRSQTREGLEEWDSRLKHGVPYAILMKIELDVTERTETSKGEETQPHKIYRIILLRAAYGVRWSASTPNPPR